jgi:hypothetical protein
MAPNNRILTEGITRALTLVLIGATLLTKYMLPKNGIFKNMAIILLILCMSTLLRAIGLLRFDGGLLSTPLPNVYIEMLVFMVVLYGLYKMYGNDKRLMYMGVIYIIWMVLPVIKDDIIAKPRLDLRVLPETD